MPARKNKSNSTPPPRIPLPRKAANGKDYNFFENVYDVVRQIPKGRITSYGAIANYLGAKMSARMVGWAMNGAHRITPTVPAHRVVNKNGLLSGKAHFKNENEMERLLNREKVFVVGDEVVEFEKKFWDPVVELDI